MIINAFKSSLFLVLFFCSTFAFSNTIFVAGDSTAATYDLPDHQGWAALLQDYFDPQFAKVDNRARGGRSTRTFISEGLWQKLLDDVKPGDYVIIQFGHNDSSPINDDRRARGTIPGIGEEWVDIDNLLTGKQERVYSFGHYLRKMVAEVKAKQATPVLLSLTARDRWHAGRLERGSGRYGWWSYQIAWETDTAFIDVTNPVVDQLEYLGKEKVAALYTKDYVHFNPKGARLHVETIVAALQGLKRLDISPSLSALGKSIAKEDWSWLRLPFPADNTRPSIFLIGDSTVRNGAGDGGNGEWGWGDFLSVNLESKKYNIVNRAVGGFSSRTFYTSGFFDKALMMMRPGDVLLMQFGHNDSSAINDDKRARGTIKGIGEERVAIVNQVTGAAETVHSYGWYLRQMLGKAKARGVRVVICSPVPRKIWDGKFIKKEQDSYPRWAKQVARESGADFIDLQLMVGEAYEKLGEKAVDKYFADEHTHTNKVGAEFNSSIVAEELKYLLAL